MQNLEYPWKVCCVSIKEAGFVRKILDDFEIENVTLENSGKPKVFLRCSESKALDVAKRLLVLGKEVLKNQWPIAEPLLDRGKPELITKQTRAKFLFPDETSATAARGILEKASTEITSGSNVVVEIECDLSLIGQVLEEFKACGIFPVNMHYSTID